MNPTRLIPNPVAILLAATLPLAACASHPNGPYVEIAGHEYAVEVADNDAARQHGLMDRTTMADDHGMLFVFEDSQPRAFWMKNTKIPLDMLFFDADNKLISVTHDAKPCTAAPCPFYRSGAPAKYVLELNAGQAHAIGVMSGAVLTVHR